jgi:hypothetical protein
MGLLIPVEAARHSESGLMGAETLIAPIASDREELAKAGTLVVAHAGLQPSPQGWRLKHRSSIDGPFAETKELIVGECAVARPSTATPS